MTHVATWIMRCLAALLFVVALTQVAEAQTSQPLALGQTVSGQFTSQTDAAYYEIAVTTTDPLVVALRGSASAGAYRLELHQGALDGPTVGVPHEYSKEKSVEVQTATPGSYFVAVLSTTTGSRTFELKAQQQAPAALTAGAALAAQALWCAGDARYFRATAATADSLIVMLHGSGFATDYELEVHQGSLAGATAGTPWGLNNDLSLEVSSPIIGDYFIVVRGATDGERTFDIRVEQRPVVQAPPGTTLSDQPLWTIGDTWYFHVAAATSDPLLVMVQGSTFSQAYELELHQGSPVGTTLGTARAYQYGQSLEVQTPTPGDYFAVVRAVATDAGQFNLRVIQRPPVLVTVGTPLTAQPLWVPGDTWYYQIGATSDPMTVLLRGSVPASGYELELHQGSISGPIVGTARDGTNDKSIELATPSTGTYFAAVRSVTDGERTFDLDVEQRNLPTVLDTSSFTDQTLWSLGDTRYYRVTAETTDPLLIMLQGQTFAPDYVLEVRQGSVAGPTVGVTSEQGNDKSVTVSTPTLGDYYVVVRNALDGARSYSLRFDQRNTLAMTPGSIVRDQQLSGQGDTRYYVVPVTGADGLVLSLQGSDFGINYVVTVHQGSIGGPSVGLTRHEGNNLFVDIVAPQIGDYYIEVKNGRPGSRTYTIQVDQVGASILSISPKSGGNAGTVTTTIDTRFMQTLSSVKLVGADGSETTGTNTRAVTDNGRFTTTFDVRDLAAGKYSVVITKPDGGDFQMVDGFTVQQGGEAKLWVDVMAPTMRLRRASRFHVAYGNSGNVDARSPALVVALPYGTPYDVNVPWGWLQSGDAEQPKSTQALDGTLVTLPNLGPGQTGTLVVDVTPMQTGQLPVRTNLLSNAALFLSAELSLSQKVRPYLLPPTDDLPGAENAIANDPCAARECNVDNDSSGMPAGTILFWETPGFWHIAKSIGCGQYIDLLGNSQWPGTGIRIRDGSSDVLAKYRHQKSSVLDSPAYRKEVRDTSLAICKQFGRTGRAKWISSLCLSGYSADKGITTNCLGFFHLINYRFSALGYRMPQDIDETWDAMGATKARGWIEPLVDDVCFAAYDSLMRIAALREIGVAGAADPNAKYGPNGYGDTHIVTSSQPMPFLVTFENLETATASAQEIVVTDQLDTSKFDLSTFALGPISFGSQVVTPPPGLNRYVTSVDLRPAQNLLVKVDAELDVVTGIVTWRLTALDPATGKPPEDALAGFLPPNTTPPNGEGSVVFTVAPKAGLTTGTEIRNKARIVFDANDPIDTAEWLNTLDNDNPASVIQPALAEVQSEATFQVCWDGADRGAGVLNYTIYVSEDNGPASVWLENTTMTCGKYKGTPGKTYSFYSVARDQVGNVEAMPSVPDAQTKVDPNAATTDGTGGSTGIGGQSNAGGVQNLGGNSATTGGQSEVDASAGGSSAVASDDAGSPVTGGTTAVAAGGTTAAVAVETGGSAARDAGPAEGGSSAGGKSATKSESDGGCGCRVGQSRSTSVGAGLLLVTMGLTLRRRNSRRARRRNCETDTNRHRASCR